MRKVIITGADGFVGSYTVAYFLKEGCEVLAVDLAPKPCRLKMQAGLTYLACDISDTDALMQQIPQGEYDTFVHFAWAGSAGAARMDYHLQMQNALNTVECMKMAKRLGCSRFVCAGSIMEYEVETVLHIQGSRPGMGYIYGMGKHISHCMCKSVAANTGIELLWAMITNAYGAGEISARFVNTTLRKMLNGEKLEFTSGTQNYDFVYVSDVARAFYLIAKNGKPFCEYMIGSGNAKPLKDFILEMVEICVPEAVPCFGDIPFSGTNMPLETFDISNTRKDCGFEPEVSFAQGIRMTMEWMKMQQEGCRHGAKV